MEHGGLGLETLKMLAAASRGTGVAPMVRVPRGEYHFIARALDVGAQGVMVPMVESAEQARGIAQSAGIPRKAAAELPLVLPMTITSLAIPAKNEGG